MIKDFDEYNKYWSRYLNEDNDEKSDKLRKEIIQFRNDNPEIFEELNRQKWSEEGLRVTNPDGSVEIW